MDELTIHPAPFIDHLIRELPELKKLPEPARLRMTQIISSEPLRIRYKHRNGDGITYPAEKLYLHFGKNYRSTMKLFFNVDDSYFHDPTNKARSYTKRYTLKPEIKNIVDSYLKTRYDQPIKILVNGKPYRTRKNAITARDINGNMKKSPAQISPAISVNVQNLHSLERYLSKLYDTLLSGRTPRKSKFSHIYDDILSRSKDIFQQIHITEIWLRITGELIRLSNIKPLPFGNLLQLYQETSTGRIQGKGIHLQTVPRPIRYETLRDQGLFQYDIENCHYQVLEQISPMDLPTVKKYNSDKLAFRRAISQQADITIKQAKTALISIIYGATDSTGYSLSETLADRTETFLSLPDIVGLFADIKTARKQIISSAPIVENQHGKFILNAIEKPISADEPPNSKLAHILQGYESQILNSILEIHAENVRLLLFDGFIADQKLNPLELEIQVLKSTGFKLRFTEEIIP